MTPKGFSFSAINAGVKAPGTARLDLALIFCDKDAVASGVFTLNKVKAAPVLIGMDLVKKGCLRAILANSGNANACTGSDGVDDARALMEETARTLGIHRDEVAPLSTGVIGVKMPVGRMLEKIPELAAGLGEDPAPFAKAIMTTDTFPKVVTRTAGAATVLGIAKGAGMIAPDMATTLAVILTDAVISKQVLDNIVKTSIESTFNAITVDGDMSTNDTLLAFSTGYVTVNTIEISRAIHEVIRELAIMLVKDGEGATKTVEITVTGAGTDAEAKKAAMAVANSLLVKTALFGADPNWGRIMAAVGYSGIPIDPDKIDITVSGYRVVTSGKEAEGFSEDMLHKKLVEKEIAIEIDLKGGSGRFTAFTSDLSYDYVKINSEYRT